MESLQKWWGVLGQTPPVVILLIGVVLATAGWLYNARRRRVVMRKQHTFNALMAATFEKSYQKSLEECRPFLREGKFPDLTADENADLRNSFRFLMNHYEFLSAGIRNGDIDEKLLKDSERGTVIKLFESAETCGYIDAVRGQRKRQSIFEHLEWLYERWEEKPVPKWQRIYEWMIARPLYHRISRIILATILVLVLLAIVVGAVVVH